MDAVKPYFHRTHALLANDAARQSVVSLGLVLCLLAGARGGGLVGGIPIKDAADGAFAADFTVLAPDGIAFSIWSLIYLGLLAYTVFQWLPGQRANPRQQAAGWLVAGSMLLNAAWVSSAQAGLVGLSLLIILALAAVLLTAVAVLTRWPVASRTERALMDVPVEIYTGWILLASGANAASWLTTLDVDLFGWGAHVWGVLAVGAVAYTGAVVAMTGRGRMAAALALCWGLFWLTIARVLGEPASLPVAISAGFAFLFVLVCGGSRTFQVAHEERRAFRQGYRPGS